jgi:hypothetical protein
MKKLSVDVKIIPAWENVIFENGDIDVFPIAENHEQGAKCNCRPSIEVIGEYILTVHNSYDKREFIEQAIAIMNGEI